MNRQAFILIEIIISIILLSITGIALFNINSNEGKLNTIALKKLKASKKVSILINQHSIYLHNKKLELYQLIKNRYNIKNQKLINILKNSSYIYQENFFSNIKLKTEENELNILIDKITVSDKNFSFSYFTIKE